MMIVGAYLVAVNVGAAGLFYYDKQCAIRHQWRVRESTLQLSALAGGNPQPLARLPALHRSPSAKIKHHFILHFFFFFLNASCRLGRRHSGHADL
jgi:uncharacterized membrane protein YsdA (DUF1294 family)